jgi:hypothetical protein
MDGRRGGKKEVYEGRKEGTEGREYIKEGRKEGRKGRKEQRKDGRAGRAGKTEGRKDRRKNRRKDGRTEGTYASACHLTKNWVPSETPNSLGVASSATPDRSSSRIR